MARPFPVLAPTLLAPTLLAPALFACALTGAERLEPFDSGTGGWRTSTGAAVLEQRATGGAPGGWLRATGPDATWHLVSPPDWAGDAREYRTLGFDLALPSRHYPDRDRAALVEFVANDGTTITWTGPTPIFSWTRVEIGLDAAALGVDPVLRDAVFGNLAAIRILASFVAGADEVVGLDSVRLSTEPPAAFASDLVATFNAAVVVGTELDGWRPVDDCTLSRTTDGLVLDALLASDWRDGRTFRVATPVAWSGDWRGFSEIRFDARWRSGGGTQQSPEFLRLVGANGIVLTWASEIPHDTWFSRVVPLTPEAWGTDAATLESVLAFVNQVQFQGEYDNGGDSFFLDNVVVGRSATPRPVGEALVARFATDTGGWIPHDNAALEWTATDGFRGTGGLILRDLGTGLARLASPDAWSGDWSGMRLVRFLVRPTSASITGPPTVELLARDGTRLQATPGLPTFAWTPYTVRLDAATFGTDEATFARVLGNVAHLLLNGDLINGFDVTRFDDVRVLAADDTGGSPPERVSGFDADAEGWRKGGRTGGTYGFLGAAPVHRTDGNPGGTIALDDEFDISWWFSPETWAGDWRGYRSISFDLRIAVGTALLTGGEILRVHSPAGDLVFSVAQPPTLGEWNRFEFELSPEATGLSAEALAAILRDVAFVAIRSEWINGPETELLDNVRVSKTPPAYHDWVDLRFPGSSILDEEVTGWFADPDGDAVRNGDEFVADTDPLDPLDRFRAILEPDDLGGWRLRVVTRPGRLYGVERATGAGTWSRPDPETPGTGTDLVVPLPPDGSVRLLRATVRLPE